MTTVIITVLVLAGLYVLCTMGRRNHPGLEKLRGWSYAHRGLHGPGRPENSMAAFRAALEHGYGIELDVHLLADGKLAVMHDSSLKRTAGADGNIEDLTAEQLEEYRLEGTSEHIPLFSQVLELFDGKAPLIVELKAVNNAPALCRAVCDLLDGYRGVYCLESFDPRCIYWLKKNRPELIRGQLTENFMKTGGKLPWILRFIVTHQIENFLILPDFIAYKYADRKTVSNFLCRKVWGVQGVSWTLRSQEEYDTAVKEGWIPIFENFEP